MGINRMETLSIMLNRYPEHMGQCILWQAPSYFSVFFTILSPFVDTVTKSKLLFLSGDDTLGGDIDKQMTEVIGTNWRIQCGVPIPPNKTDVKYDHTAMWSLVVQQEKEWLELCALRKLEAENAQGGLPVAMATLVTTSTNDDEKEVAIIEGAPSTVVAISLSTDSDEGIANTIVTVEPPSPSLLISSPLSSSISSSSAPSSLSTSSTPIPDVSPVWSTTTSADSSEAPI
jgi:hypothetical protein